MLDNAELTSPLSRSSAWTILFLTSRRSEMVNRGAPWKTEEGVALWLAGKTGDEIAKPRRKPPPKRAKAAPLSPPPVDVEIDNVGGKNGYHLIELEKGQCRFAISDNGVSKDSHVFCGVACRSGETYCEKHLKKMRPKRT
jgi:GcrA cell cycle regulator